MGKLSKPTNKQTKNNRFVLAKDLAKSYKPNICNTQDYFIFFFLPSRVLFQVKKGHILITGSLRERLPTELYVEGANHVMKALFLYPHQKSFLLCQVGCPLALTSLLTIHRERDIGCDFYLSWVCKEYTSSYIFFPSFLIVLAIVLS